MELFREKLRLILSLELSHHKGRTWNWSKDGFRADGEGPHPETIRLWRAGKNKPDGASLDHIAQFLSRHAHLSRPLTHQDFSDGTSVGDFAKILGLNADEAARAELRQQFIAHSPLKEYIFESEDIAASYFRQHGGHYHVFRRQKIGDRQAVLRMGMAITSVLNIAKEKGPAQYAIGCALSVPVIHSASELYLYTGALCATQLLVTYHFVQDEEAKRDFAILMAGGPDHGPHRQRAGRMLTMSQNGSVTVPAAYKIVIRQVEGNVEMARTEEFLRHAATARVARLDAGLRRLLADDGDVG